MRTYALTVSSGVLAVAMLIWQAAAGGQPSMLSVWLLWAAAASAAAAADYWHDQARRWQGQARRAAARRHPAARRPPDGPR